VITKLNSFLAIAAASSLVAITTSIAQDAPPLVKQINNGNWLDPKEAEALRDGLYYQRAVHAYMTMLPALNTIGMRDGSEAIFGKGYNILPIWKDRMDSRTWVPTPNADVIYSMSYLDLKETGPLVVNAPANVIGMFTDFFQRTLTDVGSVGPDRARGGLYLLLPPDYEGEIPQGYYNDGSVDLWFASAKPADVPASNFIQTVPNRNFLVALRLYGTGTEFYDQTWKPDDVVKMR